MTRKVDRTATLRDLEREAGLTLPDGSVLVHVATDVREPECREWAAYSKSPITYLPEMVPIGQTGHSRDLDDAVRYVESFMSGKRRIAHPRDTFRSSWSKDGYWYRGEVIRAADGYYLAVGRNPER